MTKCDFEETSNLKVLDLGLTSGLTRFAQRDALERCGAPAIATKHLAVLPKWSSPEHTAKSSLQRNTNTKKNNEIKREKEKIREAREEN